MIYVNDRDINGVKSIRDHTCLALIAHLLLW